MRMGNDKRSQMGNTSKMELRSFLKSFKRTHNVDGRIDACYCGDRIRKFCRFCPWAFVKMDIR
jgi:hypothetical protein